MKTKEAYYVALLLSCFTFIIVLCRLFVLPVPAKGLPEDTREHITVLLDKLKQCDTGFVFSQTDNNCIPCEKGTFSLKGWIGCLSLLDCDNIEHDIRIRRVLSTPNPNNAVKRVYSADWHGYDVVYMRCAHPMFWEDCLNNINMLEAFQGSQLVVQLIGACTKKREVVTTYYQLGSAEKLYELLPHLKFTPEKEFNVRLQLAQDYLKILHFLHHSPAGVRVMCDANDLEKTLSQFLVTDTFQLVVNDLDALPEVEHKKNKMIKCGHRELVGYFVAPEQLWPFETEPYDDTRMHGYDEKIDIWRVPDVVIWFLGDSLDGLRTKAKLRDVFSKCKSNNPKLRPTASKILEVFEKIVNNLLQ